MRTVVATAILLVAAPVGAALPDHLTCYKIKDALKLAGVVNLDSPQFGLAPGCKISSAKLFCVPAEKTVVSAADKATGAPIAPLPFSHPASDGDRICYKVKCPTPATPIADQQATDQFGARTLAKLKASMLCTPAVKGVAFCGNGTIDAGENCEGLNLGGATCATEGFPHGGTLACTSGCIFDTTACRASGLTVTGQTIAYTVDKNDGIAGPVSVPDDGTLEVGTPLAYADNGDGTVTDLNTGLIWEKKSDDGGLHDWDNQYRWDGDGTQETIWDWLDDVNAEGGSGFAGHSDWRIPNAKELESIQRLEGGTPAAVHPVFSTACNPSCTVITCSCTKGSTGYWSSTTVAANPPLAWYVSFQLGATLSSPKTQLFFVRAVR